jgi:glyoxylase-like metal-dependent hydrolase (beta-lactamase superfamily II)
MRLPLPMALDHVNIYALDDGDGWTIVDTGLSSRRPAIWEALLAGPLAAKPVTRVILTHHHPDHIGPCRLVPVARGRASDDPHRLALRADAGAGRAERPRPQG